MGGFEKQYISKIKENVKSSNAILELIDNSIDAGASKVEITYRNGKLTIVDNGKGMTTATLKKWCSNVESHCSNGKNTIGLRGVGSKAALIALSNLENNDYCMTKVISKAKNNDAYVVFWNISKNGQQYTDTSRYTDKVECGTEIEIADCVDLKLSAIKEMISSTYSRFAKKVDIFVNNEKINFVDRCYLDVLGRDINTDGVYYKNGIVFVVKTFNATNEKTLEQLSLKAVGLYVTKLGVSNVGESQRNYADYGVFTLFNNRYINYGGNVKEMFDKGNNQRGGANGIRLLLFADNSNANILNIGSDKSNGIQPLRENTTLSKFYLDGIEEKVSIFKAISSLFTKLKTINNYETRGKKANGTYNDINEGVVEKILNNRISYPKNRIINLTCEDDLDKIIPNFNVEASAKMKEMFYALHNMLTSRNYCVISRKQADRFVKDFWDKMYNKAQYQKTA